MPQDLPRNFILTSEAAQILHKSAATVRQWERRGLLPAARTDRGVRLFDRRDVEHLARQRAAADRGRRHE